MKSFNENQLSALEARVRVVARVLDRFELVQAWGHCSQRVDDEHFLVCAPKAMGMIEPYENGTIVNIHDPLPKNVLGEVRIHQQLYKVRPEVGGVCRIMPPHVTALSSLGQVPKPLYGVGAFNAYCKFWSDPRLLRDDSLALQLANTMQDSPSLVMRGNGAVTVGCNVEMAACFAWCLENSARMNLLAHQFINNDEQIQFYNDEEISLRQVNSGSVFERLWEYLAKHDSEYDPNFELGDPIWGSVGD